MVRLLTAIPILCLVLTHCIAHAAIIGQRNRAQDEDDLVDLDPIDLESSTPDSSDTPSSNSQSNGPENTGLNWAWNQLCSCYSYLRKQFNCYMWGIDCPAKRRKPSHRRIVESVPRVSIDKRDNPPVPPQDEADQEAGKEELLTPDKNIVDQKQKIMTEKKLF
jgi:hypothetical protein